MVNQMRDHTFLLAPSGVGWNRLGIALRASRDLTSGSFVNLGTGLPQGVTNFIEPESEIFLHSENGILGIGAAPESENIDLDLVDAGKRYVTLVDGASIFDSTMSFSLVRGGHIDIALLGAMEVAVNGDLANWAAPGRTPGVGGAMDLVAGCKNTWVLLEHRSKDGRSKLLTECQLPLTGSGVVKRIYTDLAVLEPTGTTFRVLYLAPGVTRAYLEEATEGDLDWDDFE